jgi:hypothetical protein
MSATWYRPDLPEPQPVDDHVWLYWSILTLRMWGWYRDYRMEENRP